ncbi:hypothetical protein P0Y35_02260 [Kiritimatiellaeota bacterium B1221]|nr:hypothetical protein [Kiritimatiellaeota bacterium B1221]
MAKWFCEDVGCETTENGQVCNFSNRQILFKSYSPETGDANKRPFDVLVGLVRFVDVLTLQKLDQLLRASGAGKFTPSLILIYRNENESDFKMSCPYCGQKLWVRDADQDKRGRCPHCSKGFTLPDQEEHISTTLRLSSDVQVRKIVRQDPGSLAGPLRDVLQLASVENSLQNLEMDSQSVINDTMRVNIVDETAE